MILQILKDSILNNVSTPEYSMTPKRSTLLDPIARADKARGFVPVVPIVLEPKIISEPQILIEKVEKLDRKRTT